MSSSITAVTRKSGAAKSGPSRNRLASIFAPRSVAVIGASERAGSVGRSLVKNLKGFPGKFYPVSLRLGSVLGVPAFGSIGNVPERVDLAVIATPAETVPGVIRECAKAGVGGVVVISAGFRECGIRGRQLEEEVIREIRRGGLRLVGPNCLGVMRPGQELNATFGATMARPGRIAFLSQSGALCTAILDWSLQENVGFSAFVSVGSMADVGWGDLIFYFGDDPETKSIIIYMESIGDARAFLSAAREVALSKPVIVIKVGRTEAAARAAASHTGSMTGTDEVIEAAFRRAGVLRVESIEELFDMAEVLGKQPRPLGPRLAIVTNAGGPGALAADALVRSGGQLAGLSAGTRAVLERVLPEHWSQGNPVDILGDATAERYGEAMQWVLKDKANDGVLVVLTPQAMTDCTATAREVVAAAKGANKPVLASWMGGAAVEGGEALLNRAGIPTFDYPDRAARAFDYLWQYSANLRALYETPASIEEAGGLARGLEAGRIIGAAQEQRRTLLTEIESKKILASYGIESVQTLFAGSEEEAVSAGERLGYPIVLKICSERVTHKSRAGGVELDLENEGAVRQAWERIRNSVQASGGFRGVSVQRMIRSKGYELIVGSAVDEQFGPVLLFGAGGLLVEVLNDRVLGLPPLNGTLARRLMERTKIFRGLSAAGGEKGVDIGELERLLVRFSYLVAEQRWIKEMDINPLLATPEKIIALDARVILHDKATGEGGLPKLAIRPYPNQYTWAKRIEGGEEVTIRPIRPEDEPLMVKFHETLSDQSIYYRYFTALKLEERIRHERLTKICFIDYDREIALVVEHRGKGGKREIVAVGRLSKLHGVNEGEFALLVADAWQRRGLGTLLLKHLADIAEEEQLSRLVGHILPENSGMKKAARRVGFHLHTVGPNGEVLAEMILKNSGP